MPVEDEVALLKRAMDRNDLAGVKALMTRIPDLHKSPLGYGKCGPLTWVAECRVQTGASRCGQTCAGGVDD